MALGHLPYFFHFQMTASMALLASDIIVLKPTCYLSDLSAGLLHLCGVILIILSTVLNIT